MKNRIVCSAIKSSCGDYMLVGIRHWDAIMVKQSRLLRSVDGLGIDWYGEQGFVDRYGQFLTRTEAWKVAEDANQIIRTCGGDDGKLFSENLY